MDLGKCECCNDEPAVDVGSLPGIPMSIAWGQRCIDADVMPYWAVVANTCCLGGMDQAAEWWREEVEACLAYFGKTWEQFENDVKQGLEQENKMLIEDAWKEIADRTRLGAYVGDGWKPVVIEAVQQIRQLNPDVELIQIKEKFGGLRLYCSGDGNEQVREIIRDAERKCDTVCEDCGATDGVTTGVNPGRYWVRTLCPACRETP